MRDPTRVPSFRYAPVGTRQRRDQDDRGDDDAAARRHRTSFLRLFAIGLADITSRTRAPNASNTIGRRSSDPRTTRSGAADMSPFMTGGGTTTRWPVRESIRTLNTPWFRPKTSGGSSAARLEKQDRFVSGGEHGRADDDAAVASELDRPVP